MRESVTVWLQGGAEFRPGCEGMDAEALAAPDGTPRRVLVLPFAGRPGRERDIAAANAERWYRGLGARDVRAALTEDGDLAAMLDDAELLVLPGGSPARLLDSLRPWTSHLRAALDRGAVISGSSAGAMVLCRWTVLPGRTVSVVAGLGLVAVDLVLPHYSGATSWLRAASGVLPRDAVVLGIPERSAAAVGPDGSLRAFGVAAFTRLSA